MIEAKLFTILDRPVEIVAEHWQAQPTEDTSGCASFDILEVNILEDVSDDEKEKILDAVESGYQDFNRIREEFLKNPLL